MTHHTPNDSGPPSDAISQATSPIDITTAIAQRVLETIDHGLTADLGVPEPGHMCLTAALCFALGLPHGEDPGGIPEPLLVTAIKLNAMKWSSRQHRARGLRRLGLSILNSNGAVNELALQGYLARLAFLTVASALQAVAHIHPDPGCKAALDAAAQKCGSKAEYGAFMEAHQLACEAVLDDAPLISKAAKAAATCARNAAVLLAYPSSAFSAEGCVACCLYAMLTAEIAVHALSAAAAVDGATAETTTRDRGFAELSECVVQFLVKVRAPGCQWLSLTEAPSFDGTQSASLLGVHALKLQ